MLASAPALRTAAAVSSASLRLFVQLRITALAPRSATPMAMAAPSPVAEPVIRITLSSKSAISVPFFARPAGPAVRASPLLEQTLGISHYLGMIEGKRHLRASLHPLGRRRIIAGPCPGATHSRQEGDAATGTARVAPGIGIDADQAQAPHPHARLLLDFAPTGGLDRLADLDKAAGQGVAPLERWVSPLHEQQPSSGVDDDAVDAERWCWRQRHRHGLCEGAAGAQIPKRALTCFSPSWCGVNNSAAAQATVDHDVGGVDKRRAIGGQPQHALGDIVGLRTSPRAY